jgi:tRNA (cmo5U34)-methyltransferase
VDTSSLMIKNAKEECSEHHSIKMMKHDLNDSILHKLSYKKFDAVVSSFAIHHLEHERKQLLYSDIFFLMLNPSGVFVIWTISSPSSRLHERFMSRLGKTTETEDSSNRLVDLHTQLEWLNNIYL